MSSTIHSTALIEEGSHIGEGSKIWHYVHVRRGASLGTNCILGRGVFVDEGVQIGNAVKIQNYVSVFHGVTIRDGAFIGPHVCFTNDLNPRAINPDGTPKAADDWTVTETRVEQGASIGANSTILCGVTIGEWSLVGAGSVVTKSVAPHAIVVGNPARAIGFACTCGRRAADLESAKTGRGCVCQKK
jgi:UDP-2-acetamido-3-amino-2,3-dideoxy-glucuronate N-acetyltransferase